MNSQPSLGTEDGDEFRIARDGQTYTCLGFKEHYGEAWHAYWKEASIAIAGGAPQPAAAAGHGGPQGRAQPEPTIAGAPQPGAAAGPEVPGTPGQQPPVRTWMSQHRFLKWRETKAPDEDFEFSCATWRFMEQYARAEEKRERRSFLHGGREHVVLELLVTVRHDNENLITQPTQYQ